MTKRRSYRTSVEGCLLKGPYFPLGDIEWTCREHGVEVALDPDGNFRCSAATQEGQG